MEIITIKVLGGILLWICMVVFGLLPIYNTRFKTNSRLLSLCNCFCGGLFLSIGLVHILPEAHDMLDGMKMKTNLGCGDDGIQWSYLICILSFSSILFLDKVVFNNADLVEDENQPDDEKKNFKNSFFNSSIKESLIEDSDNFENNFKERVSSKYKIALKLSRNSNLKGSFGKNQDELGEHDHMIKKPKLKIIKSNIVDVKQKNDKSSEILEESLLSDTDQLEIQNQKNKKKILNSLNEDSIKINIISENKEIIHNHEEHEGHTHQNLMRKDDSVLTSIILLVAMGIHGFFSLLAFGIEPSKTGTINLFIALIVHKWSEALTVGKVFYLF